MIDFSLRFDRRTALKWLALKGLSLLYNLFVRLWLLAYRIGLKRAYTSSKPILSVGNITVGGTGKTPMIDWLLAYFEDKDVRTAVLTRGYGAKRTSSMQVLNRESASSGNSRQFGDEPWMLFQKHPDTIIGIAPDRSIAARAIENDVDLLLLDDGMQHLRLNRTLNLVLIDSVSGIGNGQIFPLGPLREPLSSLKRADAVIYTRANLAEPAEIRSRLKSSIPLNLPQFSAGYHLERIRSCKDHSTEHPSVLKGKSCLLISGIGNPRSFDLVVSRQGGRVIEHLSFSDHHGFADTDIKTLKRSIEQHAPDYTLCTEKDWVKLEPFRQDLAEVWVVEMALKMEPGFELWLERQAVTMPPSSND